MKNELKSLNSYDVWMIVDRPLNAKVVKSKWIYAFKNDQENK